MQKKVHLCLRSSKKKTQLKMTEACEEQLFHLQCKDPNKKNKNQTKQQRAAAGLQWKQQGKKSFRSTEASRQKYRMFGSPTLSWEHALC